MPKPPDPHPSGARPPAIPAGLVPRHVALVMDGNGRWATSRGLPRTAGHQRGEAALLDVVEGCIELGVTHLSAYAFSTENWKRSPEEVRFLMGFNRDVLRRRRDRMNELGVRVRWAGRRPRLWRSVIDELEIAEEVTRNNTTMTLTMCVNYGGRAEITDAVRAIAQDVAAGRIKPSKIDEKLIARHLDEPDMPDVDLFVRTSGEQRISNFLIWQSAYAELVFLDTLFPDFDRRHIWQACEIYAGRQRRFGGGRVSAPEATVEPKQRYRPGSLEIFGLILLVAILLRGPLSSWLSAGAMQTWATVFVAVCVQATPFLVLGVLVSGAIAAFVPARVFARLLPDNPTLAVPVAAGCGIALPGCECGSVPIADRLMERGVPTSAALAFLLSAPAINPIVLAATAVAFANTPGMVWARLIAGLLTAVIMGWLWERIGRPEWMRPRPPTTDREPDIPRWHVFFDTVRGDFVQVAGFLVIGAAAAATFNVLVPASLMEQVGSSLLLSVLLMAFLAVVLALCSEADAFVAAAFTTIPMVGKLVFLTVGPAVDVKLAALQSGTFGRRFAVRFAPLTFVVAVVCGLSVGLLFFGTS